MRNHEKKKFQRRGSILDLLLVLLLLLCLLGAIWRYRELKSQTDSQVLREYTLTAVAASLDPRVAQCLKAGDKLYTAGGELYGEISALTLTPAKATILSNGEYYSAEWEEEVYCDLTVEILVNGSETENGILIAGLRTAVGGKLPVLHSRYATIRFVLYKMTPT